MLAFFMTPLFADLASGGHERGYSAAQRPPGQERGFTTVISAWSCSSRRDYKKGNDNYGKSVNFYHDAAPAPGRGQGHELRRAGSYTDQPVEHNFPELPDFTPAADSALWCAVLVPDGTRRRRLLSDELLQSPARGNSPRTSRMCASAMLPAWARRSPNWKRSASSGWEPKFPA